jgi:hypothetical protein
LTADGSKPIPPADRTSKDWRNRQRALLEKIAAWEAGPRTSAPEHFREKVLLYNDLLSVSPPGEGQEAVMRAELNYLTKNRNEAANRVEWFLPLNRLLARMALDPMGFGALWEEMQKSDDPIVALYTKLDAMSPRTPDRLTALL